MMGYLELAQAYAKACRERDMALAQLADIGAGYAEKMDDFVRVVRCKDCIGKSTWYKDDYGNTICGLSGFFVTADSDYCSMGEREEKHEEDDDL